MGKEIGGIRKPSLKNMPLLRAYNFAPRNLATLYVQEDLVNFHSDKLYKKTDKTSWTHSTSLLCQLMFNSIP